MRVVAFLALADRLLALHDAFIILLPIKGLLGTEKNTLEASSHGQYINGLQAPQTREVPAYYCLCPRVVMPFTPNMTHSKPSAEAK